MDIATLFQEYQLYIVGAIGFIIIISFKSEEFRNWVLRLTIFAIILSACYFGFQQVKYKFKSGNEVNPFNEEGEAEENAGMKYYRDPGERVDKAMGN